MADRAVYRLYDMLDVIDQIRQLLEGKTFDDLLKDRAISGNIG